MKAQREYFALGKDFLERGIENNPDDHSSTKRWRGFIRKNTTTTSTRRNFSPRPQPCPERQVTTNALPPTNSPTAKDASAKHYERLRQLYDMGEKERLPTLITRLKFLENKLGYPAGSANSDDDVTRLHGVR